MVTKKKTLKILDIHLRTTTNNKWFFNAHLFGNTHNAFTLSNQNPAQLYENKYWIQTNIVILIVWTNHNTVKGKYKIIIAINISCWQVVFSEWILHGTNYTLTCKQWNDVNKSVAVQ